MTGAHQTPAPGKGDMKAFEGWTARGEALRLAALTWLGYVALETSLGPQNLPIALVWASHGFVLTLLLNAILHLIRRWPTALKFVAAGVSVVAIGLAQAHIDLRVGELFMIHIYGMKTLPQLVRILSDGSTTDIRLMVNIAIYVWMFGFYAVAVSLMLARKDAFDARFEAQNAQLEALRLQLAPHFLFNALNSISTLIITGRAQEAEEMTGRLSDFYRTTLMNSGSDAVTLEAEIEMVTEYLDVERIRFGDRLRIDVRYPDALAGAQVPGLILQPLVENVIKHAVSQASGPVRLTVEAKAEAGALTVVVSDDHVGLTQSDAPSTGVGILNIRNRLRALHGDKARLESGRSSNGYVSTLVLPLTVMA
jgi:two-component system LytT family sensor kinase